MYKTLKYLVMSLVLFLFIGCNTPEIDSSCVSGPGKSINITINENHTGRLIACENNKVILSTPITSGAPGYETNIGSFKVEYKAYNYSSLKYPPKDGKPNMRRSLFFSDGQAIHAGSIYGLSHGCIHIQFKTADFLYKWAPVGTVINIIKSQ